MDLEKQVCSLELAKKLKELGVKQESLWYYFEVKYPTGIYYELCLSGTEHQEIWFDNWYKNNRKVYSAFTPAELGEMLPNYYFTMKHPNTTKCSKIWTSGKWRGHRWPYNSDDEDIGIVNINIENDTEANARTKMIIYLKENKTYKLT